MVNCNKFRVFCYLITRWVRARLITYGRDFKYIGKNEVMAKIKLGSVEKAQEFGKKEVI